MSRELLILRHAKSAWNTDAASDFERPLAKRGKKAAPRVGRFLLQQGLVPDFVVSSPAMRARQTVIAVCGQMDINPDQISWDDRIYGGWTITGFPSPRMANCYRPPPWRTCRLTRTGAIWTVALLA
jgi:phosphohistidine phosphatase SixA